jgi:hypothetical protein
MSTLRIHPEVVRFVDSARLFCALLEVEPKDRMAWVHSILAALADLYAAAHHLSITGLELTDDFPDSSFDPTAEELTAIRHRIVHTLGDDNLYWCNLNVRTAPVGSNTEDLLGVGDLADDLTDVYRDVCPGLRAWDERKDEYVADIIFGWKEPLFATHWGLHAANALQALHSIAYG